MVANASSSSLFRMVGSRAFRFRRWASGKRVNSAVDASNTRNAGTERVSSIKLLSQISAGARGWLLKLSNASIRIHPYERRRTACCPVHPAARRTSPGLSLSPLPVLSAAVLPRTRTHLVRGHCRYLHPLTGYIAQTLSHPHSNFLVIYIPLNRILKIEILAPYNFAMMMGS